MPEQGLELTSPDSFRAALVSGAGNVPAPPARPGLPPHRPARASCKEEGVGRGFSVMHQDPRSRVSSEHFLLPQTEACVMEEAAERGDPLGPPECLLNTGRFKVRLRMASPRVRNASQL